jgi:hypothetical protein
VVTILAPTPGASVPGPNIHVVVDVQPDALSQSPISSVTVCLEDQTCAYDSQAPWSVDLEATAGPHVVSATASDASGADGVASTSATVVPAPPTVTITSPADGSTVPAGVPFAVTVTATPNAATGRPVEMVELTIRDASTGDPVDYADDSVAPYSATFTLHHARTYWIEATARDHW